MPISGFAERSPLWKVFWLYGVIPSWLLWIPLMLMLRQQAHAGWICTLMIFILAHTVWIVAAVWQAACNVGDLRYGVLARALTVVWAINTVLLLFFLGLSLLG